MGGGGQQQATTQSQSVQQLPPWINDAAQQNYAYAQNVANRPLTQYQGQMVAGVAPQTQQAWNLAAQGGAAGQDQYNASQAGYLGVLGQSPLQVAPSGTVNPMMINTNAPGMQVQNPGNAMSVSAGQLAGTNLSPYMDPYTQDVINKTLPIMQQNLAMSQNQQQNAANSANAFGGSRQAIQQGVTQAQGAMGMGQMAAQLNQANFGQAQAAAQQDIASRLQASLANQQSQQTDLARAMQAALANQNIGMQGQQLNQAANLTGQQFNLGQTLQAALANQAVQQNQGTLNLQAAGGLGALGNQAQASQIRNFQELVGAGSQQQQQAQNQINAQIGKFQQAWGYPTQELGALQSALGMTPYGTATQGQSTTAQQSSPDYMMSALGGLQGLGSLFGAGGAFAPAGPTTGAGALAGIFSDRRMKTDISKVGRHPAGVDMYAFRYKGDPKHYPKVLGPMAEDVMKIAPHAVSKIPGSGGKMAVDMRALNALGGRGPPGGAALGPLASPGVAGAIGALGSPMRGPPKRRMGKQRMPPIRGALGGG